MGEDHCSNSVNAIVTRSEFGNVREEDVYLTTPQGFLRDRTGCRDASHCESDTRFDRNHSRGTAVDRVALDWALNRRALDLCWRSMPHARPEIAIGVILPNYRYRKFELR